MNDLVNLLIGSDLSETTVKIVVFLAIGEFIAALFGLIGKIKN